MLETRIAEKIKELMGFEVDVAYAHNVKNNGVIPAGYEIKKTDSAVAPVIYIDESWDDDEIVDFVAKQYLEEVKKTESVKDTIVSIDSEYIYDNVFISVVGHDSNSELLDENNIYHESYLDMEIVYRFKVALDGNFGSVKLTKNLMEHYDIDINRLREAARDNLEKSMVLSEMFDLIKEMYPFPVPNKALNPLPQMYVLTVEDGLYGASTITSEKMLQDVHDITGTDAIYIFPSSVHEIIVIPKDEVDKDDEENDVLNYKAMVHAINSTELSEEDVLTDSVYIHRRDGRMEVR